MIRIRHAVPEDAASWLRLRTALWPDAPAGEHEDEIHAFFHTDRFPREPWAVLIASDAQGDDVGLAELSIRPYAEGCNSRRVAYLEGWYVDPDVRGGGVGRVLVQAAEQWGRDEGCTEFASDADPDNAISIAAHRALGFEDVGLVRCFRKEL